MTRASAAYSAVVAARRSGPRVGLGAGCAFEPATRCAAEPAQV